MRWMNLELIIQSGVSQKEKDQYHNLKHLQIINAGEDMEKREPSCTVGENVNSYSYYGKWYG